MDLKVILLVVVFAAVECTIRDPSNRCPEVRICTADYSPVCGSDGKTYSNNCNLEGAKCRNQQLRKAYSGECRTGERRRTQPSGTGRRRCSRRCPANRSSPVCGSDGKTYSNMCSLRREKCKNRRLRRTHKGECRQGQGSTLKPVTESQCPQVCTRIYRPVCGSDGKTYSNECTMNAQNCRKRISVRMQHTGSCSE